MDEIPWIEKYRPRRLDEFIGNQAIKDLIQGFINKKNMPHLLFAGPPSTGKTTTALILARELYNDNLAGNFLELNASDERGIDTIREKVKDFAKTIPNNQIGFKIVFLDEADALTNDAQQALRRMMEIFSKHTRFILSCNYINRIIPPIQSRTAVIRFTPISDDDIKKLIDKIVDKEKINISDEAKSFLINIDSNRKDLRKIITILQSAYYMSKDGNIDVKLLEYISGKIGGERISELSKSILEKNPNKARRLVIEMLQIGADPEDLIRDLIKVLEETPGIADTKRINMIKTIADYHYRIATGADPYIQLPAMVIELSLNNG